MRFACLPNFYKPMTSSKRASQLIKLIVDFGDQPFSLYALYVTKYL